MRDQAKPEQASEASGTSYFVQSWCASNLECLGSQGRVGTRQAEYSEAYLKFKREIRLLERYQASWRIN